MVRDITFEREDGTQVLITIWANGSASMAERPTQDATWGPRTSSLEDYTH